MGRLAIGALVAAVAMFLLGWVFYGTPLMQLGEKTASPEAQLQVQEALKTLPSSGTYYLPFSQNDPALIAAGEAGPRALIKVNMEGGAPFDAMVMLKGFIHMAATAFLLGLLLWGVRDRLNELGERMTLVFWVAVISMIFARWGEPIWYATDWANALYVGAADFISLMVAGYILARWFVPRTEFIKG